MEDVEAYKKFPQFEEFCTCSNRIGIHQRKFEKMESELLKSGKTVKDARIEILKHFNMLRICCLNKMSFFNRSFINDSDGDALCDITYDSGRSVNDNMKMGNSSASVGWEFLPKTRGVFGFDLNKYCTKIQNTSMSPYGKIGILKVGNNMSNKKPVQFANYALTRHQPFPLPTQDIPFPELSS